MMEKRIVSVFLLLCFVITLFPINVFATGSDKEEIEQNLVETQVSLEIWDGSIADSYAGGNGSSGNPYLIATAGQLARVAQQTNSGVESGKYYKLTNDIYLNDTSSLGSWEVSPPQNKWIPIGTSSNQFASHFDGAGNTVFGLYISSEESCQGLFGYVPQDITVSNVGVEKSYVKGLDNIGAVLGYCSGNISNCHSDSRVSGRNCVGGIVGGMGNRHSWAGDYEVNIRNCHNTGEIQGQQYVGGIAGKANFGYIFDSYNTADISGTHWVGGIGGYAIRATSCWNAGDIVGSNYVGGIFGEGGYFGDKSAEITTSFNAGSISGNNYVGGIYGISHVHSSLYECYITDCYNAGDITGKGDYIGGITGQAAIHNTGGGFFGVNKCYYTNCYNIGKCIFGSGDNKGAIFNVGCASANNLFYLQGCCEEGFVNLQNSVVAKSQEEMQSSEFVSKLNSNGAWKWDTDGYNAGYPILNGINYSKYTSFLVSSDQYKFLKYGSRNTNCLTVGETIEIDVGCYLRGLLDITSKEIVITNIDDSIIEVKAGDWDQKHGRRVSITAKKSGMTTITFTNPKMNIVSYFDIFVVEGESGYSFDFVPQTVIEEGRITNFYNYSGLVVDDFAYKPHYNLDSGQLDYFTVTMNIFNSLDLYGAVTSYDPSGNIYEYEVIDKMDPSKTNLTDNVLALFYIFDDLFQLIDNNMFYSGESISKETNVEIRVPIGGHLTISNNLQNSEVAFFANVIGLAMEFAETLGGFVDAADALPKDVTDCLKDGSIKYQITQECIKEFTDDFANKQLLKTCKDEMLKELKAGDFSINNLAEWYEDTLLLLDNFDVDIMDSVEKKVFSVSGIMSTGEKILNNAIGTGKLIDMLFAWTKMGNFSIFAVSFSKSFSYPGGIHIYAPTQDSTFCSNGLKANIDKTDAEMVLHAFKIVNAAKAGVLEDDFAGLPYEIYSIALYKSGIVVQPQSEVKVQIPLSQTFEGVDSSQIKVYRINDDGSQEDMNAIVEGGYLIFSTNHFSYYIILANDKPKSEINISFELNGGLSPIPDLVTDQSGKLPALPTATRPSHTFLGWFTSPTGGIQVTTDTIFTQDTTIYAQWQSNSNGGGSGNNPSIGNYNVNIEKIEHGKITAKPATVSPGDTVNLLVEPDTGFKLANLAVIDGLGKEVALTESEGQYVFKMPNGSVTVRAKFCDDTGSDEKLFPFIDVALDAWYAESVQYVYENGLMAGTSATTFAPNSTTTRGQLVTILYRMEGEPPVSNTNKFDDVPAGQWYTNAVLWAADNNIVNGYGNSKFGPYDDITREQMATILHRYADSKKVDTSKTTSLEKYSDQKQIGSYAVASMQWAVAEGLITGTSQTTLSPTGTSTRAQIAAILQRYGEKFPTAK